MRATRTCLEKSGIKPEEVCTTGGKTGFRVWAEQPYSKEILRVLHNQIVSLHGRPVALDVVNFMAEVQYYRSSRPSILKTSM